MKTRLEKAFADACTESGLDESDPFVRKFAEAMRDEGRTPDLLLSLPVEARDILALGIKAIKEQA